MRFVFEWRASENAPRSAASRHVLATTAVLCVLTDVAASAVSDSTAIDKPVASNPIEPFLTKALSQNTEINAAPASDDPQRRITVAPWPPFLVRHLHIPLRIVALT